MTTVSFFGTGIMGLPMALNLIKAGYHINLSSHYKSPPAELTDLGARVFSTPREASEQSTFIITMLPDSPQVKSVLFSDDGVLSALDREKIVIDMSTISPIATKRFAEQVQSVGSYYLDAPVSGGELGARSGSLSIMVGGQKEIFERALSLFKHLGKQIRLIGDTGAGQTCKAANQIVVGLTIQAVSEAMVFARQSGVDENSVREALLGGFAQSKILDVHGQRMLDRSFKPGFKISMQQKDLGIVLDTAKTLGIELPGAAIAHSLFSQCIELGGSDWDHSALIKAFDDES